MSLTLLLAASCSAEPEWTHEQAIQPALSRRDLDGDGELSAEELSPELRDQIPWEQLDRDHSGGLQETELLELMLALDPLHFDGEQAPESWVSRNNQELMRPEERHQRDYLLLLAETLRGEDPQGDWPQDERIREALTRGEGELLLRSLQEGLAERRAAESPGHPAARGQP